MTLCARGVRPKYSYDFVRKRSPSQIQLWLCAKGVHPKYSYDFVRKRSPSQIQLWLCAQEESVPNTAMQCIHTSLYGLREITFWRILKQGAHVRRNNMPENNVCTYVCTCTHINYGRRVQCSCSIPQWGIPLWHRPPGGTARSVDHCQCKGGTETTSSKTDCTASEVGMQNMQSLCGEDRRDKSAFVRRLRHKNAKMAAIC